MKRLALFTLLLLPALVHAQGVVIFPAVVPPAAVVPAAFDTVSRSVAANISAVTLSVDINISNNSNRMVLIYVRHDDVGADSVKLVNGGTTLYGTRMVYAANALSCWTIDDPPVGLATITAYFNSGDPPSASLSAMSFYNAISIDSLVVSSSSGTSASVNVVSEPNDLVVDYVWWWDAWPSTRTAGANQTKRMEVQDAQTWKNLISTEPGATSVTMSWDWTSSWQWDQVILNVNRAP